MKSKPARNTPTCVFCQRSHGVQFAIFGARFKPFGTACVECEEKIPAHIQTPAEYFATRKECDALTQAAAARAKQFQTELAALLRAIETKATEQFRYNETTNLPKKNLEVSQSIPFALSHGIAAGWNSVHKFDCNEAIRLAHEILEDANCHTEAARLESTPELTTVE